MATTPPELSQQSTQPERPAPGLVPLIRQALGRRETRLTVVGVLGCFALLDLIFAANLQHFVQVWSNDGNYSHGFLVPLIALYFANLATSPAGQGPPAVRSGVGVGVALLAVALLGRLATVVVPVFIVGDVSFLLGLAGICALLLGTDVLRRYGFALFFLVFMIPLPVALYARIASPLQLLVSQAATEVLNLTGVPVLREGNMMTLPRGVRMFVAEACSGMRQLTGFLALTVAVAYLARRPSWYRAAVVASAIPIALTANLARVVLTGYIMHYLNPEFASGAYHTAEGLLMMGFGLSLLRGECWIMDQVAALLESAPAGGVVAGVSPPGTHAPGEDRQDLGVGKSSPTRTDTGPETHRARMDDVTVATSLAL
jgi:exosortase